MLFNIRVIQKDLGILELALFGAIQGAKHMFVSFFSSENLDIALDTCSTVFIPSICEIRELLINTA